MLVICEDCARKYDINESKIKGEKAYFKCKNCGHQIVINKIEQSEQKQKQKQKQEKDKDKSTPPIDDDLVARDIIAPSFTLEEKKEKGGLSIGIYLLVALFVGFIVTNCSLYFLYIKYIPDLLYEQVDLRSGAIAASFKNNVQEPLQSRYFLEVKKQTELLTSLPGVAYAAAVDKDGNIVAGFFSDVDRFSPEFAARVKSDGFPMTLIRKNMVYGIEKERDARLLIGNQLILDKAIAIEKEGGEIHLGIFLADVEQKIKDAIFSPFSLGIIGFVWLGGFFVFLLIAGYISRPLKTLAEVVERISLGELDLHIETKGPSEVKALARSIERMQASIKNAIGRLHSKK